MTAAAITNDRITTIMRDATSTTMKGRPRRLGRLSLSATPAAICAKLGRHLLDGLTVEQKTVMADALARILTDGKAEPAAFPPDSLQHAHLLGFGEVESRTYTAPDMDVVILMGVPRYGRGRLGSHRWFRRSTGETRRILSFRLDTMTGARDLLGYAHDDTAVRICAETTSGRMPAPIIRDLHKRAVQRWRMEDDRIANLTWAVEHSAGVFEDKKHCTLKHLEAADDSVFARVFSHVEIDDGIDLDAFHRLDREFHACWTAGELPAISPANQFRFRRTMRHRAGGGRAIGVYSPTLHAIAVDPRHPESLLHEFAHAYDFEHGQLSLTPGFQPILDVYRDTLDGFDVDDATRRYLSTPTEVWARLAELDAFERGVGGSFIDTADRYRDPYAYAPLQPFLPAWRRLRDEA